MTWAVDLCRGKSDARSRAVIEAVVMNPDPCVTNGRGVIADVLAVHDKRAARCTEVEALEDDAVIELEQLVSVT